MLNIALCTYVMYINFLIVASFQTIPIPTDSNVTDNALSDSDENNATTIIIAVVVSIAAIMIIIIATLFVSVLAWRYYQKNKGKYCYIIKLNNYYGCLLHIIFVPSM